MRNQAILFLLFVITPLLAQAQSAPEIPYESVPNFLKLPPHQYLGEAAGVAVNSKGHLFVFSRSGHTQLLEFEPDGTFLRLIGDDLYGFSFAHAVRVDKDDNIWTVDEGSNNVVEFNSKGQVIMVLGRKAEAPDTTRPGAPAMSPSDLAEVPLPLRPFFEQETFYKPTDIAWGLAGEIYVSDGYGNSRVAKFDRDGSFLKAWGQRGTGPGEFHTPHGIATDAKGNVYVADRANGRIQIFDSNGTFVKQWTDIGIAPGTLCITPPPHQVLYTTDNGPEPIYKLDLDGNVLGVFGKFGKKLGQFGWVHAMACPSENVLFVGESLTWRVQKLILHPAR